MMDVHRRLLFAIVSVAAAASIAAGALVRRAESGPDSTASMLAAARRYDSLIVLARSAHPRSALPDEQVLALGYIERLRLGLGSPFRLVDFALHDPRLSDSTRRELGWTLLARLARGDAYVLNSRTLDGLGPTHDSTTATGADHVELIERAIASASDPETGALAVRLAYVIASSDGTLRSAAADIAAEAAALVRDRRLARRDLRRLFATARQQHTDALAAVMLMRARGSLAVEQPASAPLTAAQEVAAMRSVPRLVDSIRALGNGNASGGATRAEWPVLGASAARRLAQLGAEMPFQAPVAVTVRAYRGALMAHGKRSERARFAVGARNEESLAASFAALVSHRDTSRVAALAVLTSAAQLRAYSQEVPWFPGSPAPTVADLTRVFGLEAVTFDSSVPELWRPYYLRMLASSIRDMQRVLPGLSLHGLRVAFGLDQLPDTALAMHDPSTRSIRLSILTSAGTIAHEIAHDLDWQTARRLYPTSGGYSTDHAVTDRTGALGSSVRGLTAARLAGPPGTATPPGSARPAEFFARDMDWFVAVSLAAMGRSNGYLTSVQDAALTGYAAASPNDLVAGAGAALMDAVQQMTFVPRETRNSFLMRWTDPASVSPYVLVRRVANMHLQSPPRPASGWNPLPDVGSGDLNVCFDDAHDWSPEIRARQALVELALDARARGIVKARASRYDPRRRPAWASSILAIPPWDTREGEVVISGVKAQLATRLEQGVAPGRSVLPALAVFHTASGNCVEG